MDFIDILKCEILKQQEELNSLLDSKDTIDSEAVLEMSEKLDELILAYYNLTR